MKFEFTKNIKGKKVNFEVRVKDEPFIRTYANEWSYTIEDIIINGKKIQNLSCADITEVYQPAVNKKVLAIKLQYDVAKEIGKILGVKKETLYLGIEQYRAEWEKMKEKGEKRLAEMKETEQKNIDSQFTDDNMTLEIHYDSHYGFTSSDSYSESTRGKEIFLKANNSDVRPILEDKLQQYETDGGWDDYNIYAEYKVSMKEFEGIVNKIYDSFEEEREARKIAEERWKEEEDRRKAEREFRRATMEVTILESGKEGGSEEEGPDLYANVEILDKKTGEKKQFSCRNLFDFGYVVNPLYSIDEGLEPGGMAEKDYWQIYEKGQGWVNIRKITEIEKKC